MTSPTPDSTSRMVAASIVGSAWTLLSRASGLLRLVVVAAVLGPTQLGNFYQASNQFPNLAFELLAGFLLGSLVVPAVVRHLDRRDRAAAERLASSFLSLTVLAAAAVVVVGVALGPAIVRLLTVAAPSGHGLPSDELAWLLLALLLTQVPLYSVAGMGAAAQNAQGRYALAAGAPAAENLGIIAALLIFAQVSDHDGGQVGLPAILILGGGTTGAVAIHAALQWWGAHRAGLTLTLRNGWLDPEARGLVRLAVPSLANTSLSVARFGAVLVVASAVPGGVVAFNLALAFYFLPVALTARPVALAALPEFSRAHHRSNDAEFGAALTRAVGLALFITVPAAAGYLLVTTSLSGAIAFGEMATPEGRALVQACLLGLSFGLVGEALMDVCTRAAYAKRDAGLPLLAQALRSGIGIAGMVASLLTLDGTGLLFGIGISVAASDMLAGAVLFLVLRRRLRRKTVSIGATAARVSVATLLMALVVGALQLVLPTSADQLTCVVNVLVSALTGALTYLGAQWLLGSPELRGVRTALSGRS